MCFSVSLSFCEMEVSEIDLGVPVPGASFAGVRSLIWSGVEGTRGVMGAECLRWRLIGLSSNCKPSGTISYLSKK